MAEEHEDSCNHSEWESVPLAFDPLTAFDGENDLVLTDGELLQLFTTAQQYFAYCESRFDEGERTPVLAFESKVTASIIGKLAKALSESNNGFFLPHQDKFSHLAEQFTDFAKADPEMDELARRFRDAFSEDEEGEE